MSRIFLSHSSADNASAIALRDWLKDEGWEDVFLDLDPERGIAAGERWERALNEAAGRCEAVLFLVSPAWLKSAWCLKEYRLADKLNKRMFGCLLEGLTVADVPPDIAGDWQLIDLASGRDHIQLRAKWPGGAREEHVTFSQSGLARLRTGLAKAGLHPRFFAWPPANDPNRAPYRGLKALEASDAGIFFGREAPTIAVLDRLRGLRDAAPPRFLAILGASGAGKSSFLRAGLLPRLARDDRKFLPLPVVRPERAALTGDTGLVASLAAAYVAAKLNTTRAEVRAAVGAGAAELLPLLEKLAAAQRVPALLGGPEVPSPTVVLPIDQGEELFLAEGSEEARFFLALVKTFVLAPSPALIVLVAIRSDAYERLQAAPELAEVTQDTFSLPPMPRGEYANVIEGPARRRNDGRAPLTIEPALTHALLADIETGGAKDSLPLLAFTLERLFLDYGSGGDLTLAEYKATGGVRGSIEAAVGRAMTAADTDPRIPREREARLALLRRALIPWLAGIDTQTGVPRRRVARVMELPYETRPLVEHLVTARLLATDTDETGKATIEPVHEALLRQWGLLEGWLKEDFAALAALDGVKRAAHEWESNARDKNWLNHHAGRLEDAERFATRADLIAYLSVDDRAYLAACRAAETDKRDRELEEAKRYAKAQKEAADARGLTVRRTRLGLAVAVLLAILAVGATWFAHQKTTIAKREALKAEQRSAILATEVSNAFTNEGALDSALLLMLDAARVFDDQSAPDAVRIAFSHTLEKRARVETRRLFPNMRIFEANTALILIDPLTNDIWALRDSVEPTILLRGTKTDGHVLILRQSEDGNSYTILRDTLVIERLDATTGSRLRIGAFPKPNDTLSLRKWSKETIEITEDDLVVRERPLEEGKTYVHLFDTKTGTAVESEVGSGIHVRYRRVGGGFHAYDEYKKTVTELSIENGSLIASKAEADKMERLRAQFGSCVAGMNDLQRESAIQKINAANPNGQFSCTSIGNAYIVTTKAPTTADWYRKDFLLEANGVQTDVGQVVINNYNVASGTNFSYVTATPPNGKNSRIAVLQDRTIYVLQRMGDWKGAAWQASFAFRQPGRVNYARFVTPDTLVVIDADSGLLYAYTVRDPIPSLFGTALPDFIGTNRALPTMQKGSCVGGAIEHLSHNDPNRGREIFIDTDILFNYNKRELKITSNNDSIIHLSADTECVQFSENKQMVLALRNDAITLFDFPRALSSGSAKEATLGTIPVKAGSAYFVGPSEMRVVTTDGTNRVQLWTHDGVMGVWSSQEVYHGDKSVIRAEPDLEGKRLIVVENEGHGSQHAVFYSMDARQTWFDLGSAYKFLGVTFIDKTHIAVADHHKWRATFPILPLSSLQTLADQALADECRPLTKGDYRSSRCWPATQR